MGDARIRKLDMIGAEAWRNRAACREAPGQLDLRNSVGGDHTDLAAMVQARPAVEAYCSGCPVRAQCFDWAQQDPYFEGIAGAAVWGAKCDASNSGYRRRFLPVTPRPDLGGLVMLFDRRRPLLAHLAVPGMRRAACGATVNAGHSGKDRERTMALPRCRDCQRQTGRIMPPPVPVTWKEKAPSTQAEVLMRDASHAT